MVNKWKLLEAIDSAGYSQRSLSKAIGVSKNTLNSKINGHIPFTTKDIDAICEKIQLTDPLKKAEIFLS